MPMRLSAWCSVLVVGASGTTLREAAQSRGVYVGTAINTGKLNDATYTSVAKEQYDLVTAENSCKWDETESQQGKFTFSGCDSIRDFALKEMKGVFRGHNLCWGNQIPSWTKSLNATGKRAALQEHAKALVSHYGTDAFAWDVVNEAITDSNSASDPLKSNNWYPDVPDYLDVCFKAAKEAAGDKNIKLFYNDYSVGSTTQKKSDRMYNYIKAMKSRGVPIDGVGFQMHIGTWADNDGYYEGFKANIQRFADLGLEVHITELDIAFDSWSEAEEQKQANMYAKLLQACLDVSACKNFETWGFTDASTWKGSDKHPLPFDAQYKAKKAVASMIAVLQGSPAPSPPSPPAPTPPSPGPSPTRSYETLTTTCKNAAAITGKLSVSSVEQCEALCDAQAGCVAVDTNGADCYLKSHCEGTVGSCSGWCARRIKSTSQVLV